ncbi:hypothetical protein SAMN05216357_12250 [Porphyromonadaceae bacterium KH3CP3RA]|nr:hypothetical protein SAMN05216357_12250 [Porphyromonadaceae bacterium KH3CP3RA]
MNDFLVAQIYFGDPKSHATIRPENATIDMCLYINCICLCFSGNQIAEQYN